MLAFMRRSIAITIGAGTLLFGLNALAQAEAATRPAEECVIFCVSDGKARSESDGGGFFGSKGKRSNPPSFDWGGGWGDVGKAPKHYKGGWGVPFGDTPKHKSPDWGKCAIFCG